MKEKYEKCNLFEQESGWLSERYLNENLKVKPNHVSIFWGLNVPKKAQKKAKIQEESLPSFLHVILSPEQISFAVSLFPLIIACLPFLGQVSTPRAFSHTFIAKGIYSLEGVSCLFKDFMIFRFFFHHWTQTCSEESPQGCVLWQQSHPMMQSSLIQCHSTFLYDSWKQLPC